MEFELVWFDSLGAKSSCTLVKTDSNILIDPGVAIMHPGFPASDSQKISWYEEARARIKSKFADVVIISHYHYDHFIDFDRELYAGKLIFAKNPNEYINDSQRKRAEKFFGNLCKVFGEIDLREILKKPEPKKFEDPTEELEISTHKNFADYQERRAELLENGRKWFFNRAKKWCRYRRIPEMEFKDTKVKFADGREFRLGKTRLRFTRPLFHGIEFSRVGWVFATVVEFEGEKLIHTSDINGPVIEDYAEWIIRENPQILILDGPMTYMLGYTLNLINFRRTIENMLRIINETETDVIIYDHHLPREPRFRERTRVVWESAERLKRKVFTAADFLGKKPAVLGD
ncbi:MBL fold metallo-hydrolase [Methanosarcinales archaeon]|nr:MAG: MBL fold metallo-hydrolase [Methanosarcinales archaeon]